MRKFIVMALAALALAVAAPAVASATAFPQGPATKVSVDQPAAGEVSNCRRCYRYRHVRYYPRYRYRYRGVTYRYYPRYRYRWVTYRFYHW